MKRKFALGVTAITLSTTGAQALAAAQAAPAELAESPVAEPQGAIAEDEAGYDGEIIVTAQKRSEKLSDVPLSITAASSAQLRSQGITDTSQLEKLVPGFTFQQGTFGVPVFTIRGVGFFDTTLATTPAVSVYVDQIPLPYLAMSRGAILDVERVEALKGPQGTLFGQNSTGGAINYIAAKPTQDLEAGVILGFGRFNAVEAEAFLSGPISDTLSARIAVRSEYQDDWQRSYTRNDTLGEKHFYNGRALLDWTPSDRVKFELSASAWQDQSNTVAGQFLAVAPTNPNGWQVPINTLNALLATYGQGNRNARSADWDADRNYVRNDRFYQFALRSDIELADDITLTSLTSFSHLNAHIPSDVDGTSYADLNITVNGVIRSFNQELRLAGEAGGRLKYMVGVNYQKDRANEDQLSEPQTSTQPANATTPDDIFPHFFIVNHQDVETKSVFGSIDYQLTDTLTLQGSARYTKQDRDFSGCAQDFGDGSIVRNLFVPIQTFLAGRPDRTLPPGSCITMQAGTFEPVGMVHTSLNEDNVSWRGSVNWKPNTSTLLYANVTKGYKAGSYPSVPGVFTDQLTPVKQESVLAYEAGFKLSLFDRSLQVEGAGFYYDYRDKQILNYRLIIPLGPLPALITLPKSRIAGAEMSMTWRPIEGLRLTGGATYVSSKIQKDPVAPFQAFDTNGALTSFVGEQFPNTPKWQFVGDGEYGFPLGKDMKGFVGANVSYRSSSPAVLGDTPGYTIHGYALVDLRAGIAGEDDAWRFEIWGRNVTNKYYVQNISHTVDTVLSQAGMPVTYGARLSYRFR